MNMLEYENKFLTKCLEDELASGNQRMKLMRDTGRMEGWVAGMIVGIAIGVLVTLSAAGVL